MKTKADVVVIGGGIMGSATAYELARRGSDVVLLEKGPKGGQQSTRAWGFVRQQGRDLAELPLAIASNRIWPELSAELGSDVEWVQQGNLMIADNEERMQQFRDWVAASRDYGVDTRLISPEEIHKLVPGIQGEWLGGMYTPSDGHAEPGKAPAAFTDAAQRLGATVETDCTAQSIELAGGRVIGVRTDQGTIAAPLVVVAAGGWSSRLLRTVGLNLPQLVVRGTAVETVPVPPITGVAVAIRGGLAFRQRPGGSLYMSLVGGSDHEVTLDSFRYARDFMPNYRANRGFLEWRVTGELLRDAARSIPGSPTRVPGFDPRPQIDPTPNNDIVEGCRRELGQLFPALENTLLARKWAGLIDTMPDGIPVIGAIDERPGLIVATGFSGHGFALGPIVGRVVSELILDGQPSVDLHKLRYSRFKEKDVAPPRATI
ncbi:MAG TPA: FAD-binding oxidoreductase [Thermomicrobiales bacterium]|nr:FAD-binding oxidoreductase [Thermomicrobiales bacterium]